MMVFKFKSEWLSIFTLGGLVIAAVALPKHSAPTILGALAVPSEGIDYTPIGSSHAERPGKGSKASRLIG